MPRAALLSLLLLGACASADTKEREAFFEGDRPHTASEARATGNCKPWFVSPARDWGEGAPKHSCWNRFWEVPTALVVVPAALGFITAPIWVPILLL